MALATLVGQLKDFSAGRSHRALAVSNLRAQGLVEAGDNLSATLRGQALFARM